MALWEVAAGGPAETAAEIRNGVRRALELALDLSQRSKCTRAVDATLAEFDRLDALCNVAGVMKPGQTPEFSDEAWDLTMRVNLEAPFFLIRASLPHLLESGGAVVNVTSCNRTRAV